MLHFHINLEIFFPYVHFAQFVENVLHLYGQSPPGKEEVQTYPLPVKGGGADKRGDRGREKLSAHTVDLEIILNDR